MKFGFAIGNGTSREGFDLEQLRGQGTTVGCNWIYKDFQPDIVVAIDRDPRTAIGKLTEREFKLMTVNKDRAWVWLDDERVMSTSEVNRGIGKFSGLMACSYLAKVESCKRVYMFGFDFFQIKQGMTRNDIYHDKLLGNRNAHRSFLVLAKHCVDTEFIRVGPVVDEEDEAFFGVLQPHFTLIDYSEFEGRLANREL